MTFFYTAKGQAQDFKSIGVLLSKLRPEDLSLFDHTALPPFPMGQEQSAENVFSVKYYGHLQDVLLGAAKNMKQAPGHLPDEHGLPAATFAEFYATLPRPDRVIHHYWRDSFFSEQRLAGVNPMVIRRVKTKTDLQNLQLRFAMADHHLRDVSLNLDPKSPSPTLSDLVKESGLFYMDYQILEGLPTGSYRDRPKYLSAPMVALFWRPSGHGNFGELVPFAIQLGQSRDLQIFTPRNSHSWSVAKLMVQAADGNHHEMATHLARTHLAVEPFAVATTGILSKDHPVRQFLAPALKFVTARNLAARQRLINPGGPVEDLLATTLQGSLEIARRSRNGYKEHSAWGIQSTSFWQDIVERGMDTDPAHYPYRDDGKLLWEAMGAYATTYVQAAYHKKDLKADTELQRWAITLASKEGGDVNEMPGSIAGKKELASILRTVIFISGPMHAAVNFPQYEFMTFVPNMPLATYASPPSHSVAFSKNAPTLDEYLPPMGLAAQQFLVLYGLSAYQHDRLGDYDISSFSKEVQQTVRDFQDELPRIERIITQRNSRRMLPYPYLLPSRIPNSASV